MYYTIVNGFCFVQVIVWKESNGTWNKLYEYSEHKSSGYTKQNWTIETVESLLLLYQHNSMCTSYLSPANALSLCHFSSPSLLPLFSLSPPSLSPLSLPFSIILVNSIQWAPQEWGLLLACASSDESFSILYTTGELLTASYLFLHVQDDDVLCSNDYCTGLYCTNM